MHKTPYTTGIKYIEFSVIVNVFCCEKITFDRSESEVLMTILQCKAENFHKAYITIFDR